MYVGIIAYILGLYRDYGKEDGKYYIIMGQNLGLYWGYSIKILGGLG